jgi:hypothetical protein
LKKLVDAELLERMDVERNSRYRTSELGSAVLRITIAVREALCTPLS